MHVHVLSVWSLYWSVWFLYWSVLVLILVSLVPILVSSGPYTGQSGSFTGQSGIHTGLSSPAVRSAAKSKSRWSGGQSGRGKTVRLCAVIPLCIAFSGCTPDADSAFRVLIISTKSLYHVQSLSKQIPAILYTIVVHHYAN